MTEISRKKRSTSLPAKSVAKIPQKCNFYLKGKCKWADFCRFEHKILYRPKECITFLKSKSAESVPYHTQKLEQFRK